MRNYLIFKRIVSEITFILQISILETYVRETKKNTFLHISLCCTYH